MTRLNVSLTIH